MPNLETFEMLEAAMASDDSLKKRNGEIVSKANPLFDQLNSAWEKIENFFRSQGILQEASCSAGTISAQVSQDPEDIQVVGQQLLGLRKHGGKWRICYGEIDSNLYEHWTPILDCSVELRVEMLDYVDALFAALVRSNESYVPKIEEAVAKAGTVLKNLGISK